MRYRPARIAPGMKRATPLDGRAGGGSSSVGSTDDGSTFRPHDGQKTLPGGIGFRQPGQGLVADMARRLAR